LVAARAATIGVSSLPKGNVRSSSPFGVKAYLAVTTEAEPLSIPRWYVDGQCVHCLRRASTRSIDGRGPPLIEIQSAVTHRVDAAFCALTVITV